MRNGGRLCLLVVRSSHEELPHFREVCVGRAGSSQASPTILLERTADADLPRVMLRAPLRVVAWLLLLLMGLARPMWHGSRRLGVGVGIGVRPTHYHAQRSAGRRSAHPNPKTDDAQRIKELKSRPLRGTGASGRFSLRLANETG
jgi:hypothetical protein